MDVHPRGHLAPDDPERAYALLTGYRLAQRYVEGKSVLNVLDGRREDAGYGYRLIAQTAERVSSLDASDGETKYPEDHFDAAVALQVIENLEDPERLISGIQHTLKPGGILVLSTLDKQSLSGERWQLLRENNLYVQELQGILAQRFENVRVFRLGVVAGGVVLADSGVLDGAEIENAGLSLSEPTFEPATPFTPSTSFVIAVCSDAEIPEVENPYLLLDFDRRVFAEYADRVEDVRLLQEEIRRMQETEVQAFRDALKLRDGRIAYFTAHSQTLEAEQRSLRQRNRALRSRKNTLRARNEKLETRCQNFQERVETLEERLRLVEGSRLRLLLASYRGLRSLVSRVKPGKN